MARMEISSTRIPDVTVTAVVALLTVIGLVMAFSTSKLVSTGDEVKMVTSHFQKQLLFAAMGIAAYWFAAGLSPESLRKYSIVGLVLTSVLLALVLWSPLGVMANGATRWLKIGPLRFQPSEIAKLVLVIFLADSLARRGPEKMKDFRFGFLPNLLIPGLPIALVALEKDLGTAVVMVAIICGMVFIAGAQLKHLAGLILLALLGMAIEIIREPYRVRRILAFMNPEEHMLDSAFQLTQSQLAFASGGLWGAGIGSGQQKLFYLPEAHTDFILSVWGEETGLIGTLVVIGLFMALTWRGITIGIRQKDPYRRFLAVGITSWLAIQAAINAMVVLGAAPTKGLPLPFLSYGGTGLVVTLAAAGLLAGLARPLEEPL